MKVLQGLIGRRSVEAAVMSADILKAKDSHDSQTERLGGG
jgi:hypothetical protein